MNPTTTPTTPTTTQGTTEDPTATTGTTTDNTTTDPVTGTSTGTTGDPPLDNICTRLGGMADDGIPALVNGFLGKVLVNDKINGYFLNSDIDGGALGTCVINQLGAATGCPDVVYECKTMLEAHAGLGISQNDFDDFVVDFVAALEEHAATHPDLTDDDKTTIGTVLGSMSTDIVEDATNDATVYQRVGRKPAIKLLIGMPTEAGSFVDNVANNAAINNFFGATMFDRLNTCLTRQVSSIDGPIKYGSEVTAPAPARSGRRPRQPLPRHEDEPRGHAGRHDGGHHHQ